MLLIRLFVPCYIFYRAKKNPYKYLLDKKSTDILKMLHSDDIVFVYHLYFIAQFEFVVFIDIAKGFDFKKCIDHLSINCNSLK